MTYLRDPKELIPVTLLTGFLGSGKTTVLNRLLKSSGSAAIAVVINEFGEIGLDHLLVERTHENFVMLNSGCLCCTVRGDLIATLGDLSERRFRGDVPDFARIVIETTGLADPAPILHTLIVDRSVASRYKLDGVITTIDTVNGAATLDRHREAVKQAAVADRLLLTKVDLTIPENLVPLCRRLELLNPGAHILETINGAVHPRALFDLGLYNTATKTTDVQAWLRAERYEEAEDHHAHGHQHPHADHAHDGDTGHTHAPLDVNRHDDRISAYCVTLDRPVKWTQFSAWIDLLAAIRGEDLLRVKGIVSIADRPDRPVAIHGVQHLFHPPMLLDRWPGDDRRTRIVFITQDIPKSAIEDMLHVFADEASTLKVPKQADN
jgi:G3E family GTPase